MFIFLHSSVRLVLPVCFFLHILKSFRKCFICFLSTLDGNGLHECGWQAVFNWFWNNQYYCYCHCGCCYCCYCYCNKCKHCSNSVILLLAFNKWKTHMTCCHNKIESDTFIRMCVAFDISEVFISKPWINETTLLSYQNTEYVFKQANQAPHHELVHFVTMNQMMQSFSLST